MNRFTKWLFRRIVREAMHPSHSANYLVATSDLYGIIADEAQKIFYEDNAPTLKSYLQTHFDEGWKYGEAINNVRVVRADRNFKFGEN